MLIIDNYDSFSYNIVQYVKILGVNPIVIKNDEMSLSEIKRLKFEKNPAFSGLGQSRQLGCNHGGYRLFQRQSTDFGGVFRDAMYRKIFWGRDSKSPRTFSREKFRDIF